MSDQLNTVDTIDESTLDPKIVEYFTKKFDPVVKKKDELLGDVAALKALKKDLDALGGLDTIKSLKTKADEAAAAAERERLEKLSKDGKLTEVEEHYKKLLAEKDGKLTGFQQKLLAKEVESKLAAAIGDEGSPVLLMPHMRDRVQASFNEEGEIVLTVKGAAGQSMTDSGTPMTVADLVAEFKANPMFAGAFKAHQASGGGGKGGKGAGTPNNPFAKNTLNLTQQSELIRSNPDLARKLATEAGEKVDW